MDNVLAMAKVEGIRYCQNNLGDLTFISTTMQVVFRVEFTSFAVFHDNIKESGVIEDLVDFYNVWMLELSHNSSTERRI